LIVEHEKVSWGTAEQYIQELIKFMKQSPNFSAQEVMQAHVLQNVLIKKKQTCLKQDDIRTLFKRASEKAARISRENLATPTTYTSDIADLPEEEKVDDVSAPSESAPRTSEGQYTLCYNFFSCSVV
jgi:ABC-type proline/glycine betaine transport system ATPase subunit